MWLSDYLAYMAVIPSESSVVEFKSAWSRMHIRPPSRRSHGGHVTDVPVGARDVKAPNVTS
jgi:hypothetical protein